MLVRETQRPSERPRAWGHFPAEVAATARPLGLLVSGTSQAGSLALPGRGSRVPRQELTCPRGASPSLPSGKGQKKTENEWKTGGRCPSCTAGAWPGDTHAPRALFCSTLSLRLGTGPCPRGRGAARPCTRPSNCPYRVLISI